MLAARQRECIQVTYWLPRWPFLHVHSRGHTCCLNFHACFLSTSGYSSFLIIFFSKKGVYRINMFLLSSSDSYSINFFSRGWGDHYVRSLRFFFSCEEKRRTLCQTYRSQSSGMCGDEFVLDRKDYLFISKVPSST